MVQFTAKQLEDKLEEISTFEVDIELPIYLGLDKSESIWEEEVQYPIIIKDFLGEQYFRINKEDSFYGEEGGDHQMYVILSTGYGDNKRYFRKDGQYDSWAESSWDGGFYEVEQKEKIIKVWTQKKSGAK